MSEYWEGVLTGVCAMFALAVFFVVNFTRPKR